jgi:hypothetical protein
MKFRLGRLWGALLLVALLSIPAQAASAEFKVLGKDATGDASGSAPDLTKVSIARVGKALEVRLHVADMAGIGTFPSADFSWAFSVGGYEHSCCRLVAEIESVGGVSPRPNFFIELYGRNGGCRSCADFGYYEMPVSGEYNSSAGYVAWSVPLSLIEVRTGDLIAGCFGDDFLCPGSNGGSDAAATAVAGARGLSSTESGGDGVRTKRTYRIP